MCSLPAHAVAAEPPRAIPSGCTKFVGGGTRLGIRRRRANGTGSLYQEMPTAQFEGLLTGLGPSSVQRGLGLSLAWRRGTLISGFHWPTTPRGSASAARGSPWMPASPLPPTAWPPCGGELRPVQLRREAPLRHPLTRHKEERGGKAEEKRPGTSPAKGRQGEVESHAVPGRRRQKKT